MLAKREKNILLVGIAPNLWQIDCAKLQITQHRFISRIEDCANFCVKLDINILGFHC